MVTEWKLYAILAAIAIAFTLGFYTCHKFNQAAQDKADQAIIAEQQKNAQLLGQISEAYEKGRQSLISTQLQSTLTLSRPNAKYSSCVVAATDRRLLVAASIAANNLPK